MFSLNRRLFAGALFLLPCLAAGALSAKDSAAAGGSSKDLPEAFADEAQIYGDNYHTEDGGNLILLSRNEQSLENPSVVIGDLRLEAEKIIYNQRLREVKTAGEVKINFGALRVLALDVTAEMPLDGAPAIRTGEVRLGAKTDYFRGGYVQGKTLDAELLRTEQVSTSTATLNDVTLYYQEPDFFSISVDASKIVYRVRRTGDAEVNLREDSEVEVSDAVVRIAGIPVFYIPSYSQTGLDVPPIDPYVRAGYKSNLGVFLRTTMIYTGFKEYHPGLLLDGYGNAGVLVGPALRYDTRKTGVDNLMSGMLQGAWINDNSDRGTDDFGNPIENQRGFFIWNHKQKIADALEITSSLNYWSDTTVVRDFRPTIYDENQQPDSFFELVYPDRSFYASAFARYRPNDFADVQQRLPEIRFDLNPREIFDTGIYQRLNVSFAYLLERESPELPALPGGRSELDSPRFDAYYGLTRAIKPCDWLTFTPVAGVRSTTYFDTLDDGDPYTRVLPQLGFDLQMLAQGQWGLENDFWEIRGLRHQVRPLVQYRWIPAADKGASRIPQIDRFGFTTYPPPIDLSQKRYADDLWEQQVLRVGVENIFQTRAEDYGSRNLAWLNVYEDFRDTDRAGERVRSDLYTQLGFAPAYWLDVELYNRLDTYSWHSNEISARIDVHDGDVWRAWVGVQYLTDLTPSNQYFWGFDYQINSDYGVRAQWRYDVRAEKLTEQTYGLRQRLGSTWTLEYVISFRENTRENDDFSFGVNLRMNTF